MIAAPSSPDGSTGTFRCPQDIIAGERAGSVRFPRFGLLSGRDDRGGTAGGDGRAPAASIAIPIVGGHANPGAALRLGQVCGRQAGSQGIPTLARGGKSIRGGQIEPHVG